MDAPSERYRIIRPLGDGGMGTVFLAVVLGEGGFEKRVALKRLKPELSRDPESVELFMREAKLAAQLNHPNIVQVFDGGLDHGNLFLVLEYVDGGDLEGVIRACRRRNRAISAGAIAHVGAQVCEALCCLFELRDAQGRHQVQAHRDISPGNVLLARNGVAKLSDFGVVRLRESKTAIGKVRGKWEYFPPELVRGTHDQRGDLFALGVTLYKLAALQHPFDAETPPKHFERACRDEPAPIPELPEALWGIISRALSKDPRQRYQTAEEMGADLDAFVTSCHERISPRYLAQELFGAGPPPPVTESSATQLAAAIDLFAEFDRSARARPISSEQRSLRETDELRQFEEVFGANDEHLATDPLLPVAGRARTNKAELILRGPATEVQLRALHRDFVTRTSATRKDAPSISFERLALLVQKRRTQIVAELGECPISVSVVMQGERVVVRLRPLDEGGRRNG